MDTLRDTFLDEARELLAGLQGALLAYDGQNASDTVQAVFRSAHTLKGAAGVVDLPNIVGLAHAIESVLDRYRAEPALLDDQVVALFTEGHDELERLLDAVASGEERAPAPALMRQLDRQRDPGSKSAVTWRLHVAFDPHTFRDGMDPLGVITHLETLGSVQEAQLVAPRLPVDGFDPRRCYFDLAAKLVSSEPRPSLESAFSLLGPATRVTLDPDGALEVDAPPPGTAAATRTEAGSPKLRAERTVKVPAERLDGLVDLVGELVTAGSIAGVHVARTGDRSAIEAMAQIQKIVAGVRDATLGLRMVQIGETFDRFRRVVREVAGKLGKEVEVVVRGGETELDKSMVDRLADPLIHIVRNAVDHGIEAPEVRERAGKPRRGRLTLDARHQGGRIVIDVADDGAGVNRDKVRRKAIEKGLISPTASLTDAQVDDILFLPGFSSADQVTDVSGRGVGMDVVRKSIEQLRGQVEILSTPGCGTTLRLALPLTLAIIDGFLVDAGGAHFVVPSKVVRECLDFATVLDSASNQRLNVRGLPVPFVRLRDLFGLSGQPAQRESVVILDHGDRPVGMVVDRLFGVSQTVIKPLGPLMQGYEALSGSTVLGTGEVAFILDVNHLVTLAASHRSSRSAGTRTHDGVPHAMDRR
jgi:two-component system chemotaxis sensor kinase CheA